MTQGKDRAEKETGGPLYRKLAAYGESDYYGFHMPGHKRKTGNFRNPYSFDITEIEGFDDLHHPEGDGILTKAQERAARLYKAEETHFLVGGSTAGILSAVSGCCHRGGRVLMARNCHRSVYHAAELGELEATYLYPQQVPSLGINGAVCPEDVEKALAYDERIEAVIITSPTYDGVCSDVRAIAGICHRHKAPLIVDQAHGAHFPFSDYFPEDAVSAGADVVIHSVHKTLPALTQTALLHVQGKLANRERIRRFLSVYQSSSPSYVLMASIDACVDLLEREGEELFCSHVKRLSAFRESCRELKTLYLAGKERIGEKAADFDRSKLLVSTGRAGITGSRLSRLLLERYHIQMEMTAPDYVVGIASVADTEEGFARLGRALRELDAEFAGEPERLISDQVLGIPRLAARMTAGEAVEKEKEACGLSDCVGRLSTEYVYLYPPGIPLIVPGEEITAEASGRIGDWLAAGLTVHGLDAAGKAVVIKERE